MANTASLQDVLDRAAGLRAGGQLVEAEGVLKQALAQSGEDEALLLALRDLYGSAGFRDGVTECCERLFALVPSNRDYALALCDLHAQSGRLENTAGVLDAYLAEVPEDAGMWAELGVLRRRLGENDAALAALDQALGAGAAQPAQIELNRAVILSEERREADAIAALERAIETDPGLVPARFNLAALVEDSGDIARARQLYADVLERAPDYAEALARLAGITPASEKASLANKIEQTLARPGLDANVRVDLLFALGKQMDDAGEFGAAFKAFAKANSLDRQMGVRYDRAAQERQVDAIISAWPERAFESATGEADAASDAAPIFICGMFRSGSTLTEQILGRHGDVTAGGEIEYFDARIARELTDFPETPLDADAQASWRADYVDLLNTRFGTAVNVTDKRPDNFLYLGLILQLFPNARVICTRRDPLDTAVSLYATRLGPVFGYASGLADIGHYQRQYDRLMAHWKSAFGDRIHEVSYDTLVAGPEAEIRAMLEFCGLAWDPACLSFHEARNVVKTASAWQVRQKLHTRSSGRAEHYRAWLDPLIAELEKD